MSPLPLVFENSKIFLTNLNGSAKYEITVCHRQIFYKIFKVARQIKKSFLLFITTEILKLFLFLKLI